MKILITRPEPDASLLAQALEKEGHCVRVLPLSHIVPQSIPAGLYERSAHFIFVSKNAVRSAPPGKKVGLFAVGPGTAHALIAQGAKEVVHPVSSEGSDALLALPALQHVAQTSWVIIRGEPGRDHIEATLRARGAKVESVVVYTAFPPVLSASQKRLLREPYDLAIVTSSAALRFAAEQGLTRNLVVSVLSSNMLDCAKCEGFTRFLPLKTGANSEIITLLKKQKGRST